MDDLTPGLSDSPELVVYKKFVRASIAGDVQGMRACVNVKKFFAKLPQRGLLMFDELVEEFRRLAEFSPDLGGHLRILDVIQQGGKLAVTYFMRYHVRPANRLVELTSIDKVVVGPDGLIAEIRTYYDTADPFDQAFGSQRPDPQ